MYVCVCEAVSDQDIRHAIADGARTFEDVQATTHCTTCCGCCETEARQLVQTEVAAHAAELPVAA